MSNDKYRSLEITAKLYLLGAQGNYYLECFGNKLANEQGFKDIEGIEAIRHYLMIKHNWLPSQVQSMSLDVIRNAVNEEYQDYTPSREEIMAFDSALKAHRKP